MNLHFNASLAEGYHGKTQIARVLTEGWTATHLFCPVCGHPKLEQFPNNQATADFYCPTCGEQFEQKSKDGPLGHKIPDGAYETFIQRISSNSNPNFLIMRYSSESLSVRSLYFIPKYFLVPEIVEKRKPLSSNARRAGWVGCNILYDQIPHHGRITIVENGIPIAKSEVLQQVQQAQSLRMDNLSARGWTIDILNCIDALPTQIFTLDMMYQFEAVLAQKHPNNHHIRSKIRQQLQLLRDLGVIMFGERGKYEKR